MVNEKKIIKVEKLAKTYGPKDNFALDHIDLAIKEGTIFGLLGPNGAGKSTFINILAGLTNKTSGKVSVCGINLDLDPKTVRGNIGVVPQEINIDPFFTPLQILEIQSGLYAVKENKKKNQQILGELGLKEMANAYSRSLSGGMKRRLMVAKAMVHNPPILILDEPTAGVDVELRKKLWESIRRLNKKGVTIILTTHYLKEAELMCDRIGVLNKGNLVALDSTQNLLNRIQMKKVTFKLNNRIELDEKTFKSLKIIYNKDNELSLSYDKNKIKIEEIIKFITSKNINIDDISTNDGDLEDVFLQLTND